MKPLPLLMVALLSTSALAQQAGEPREPTEDEFLWIMILTTAQNPDSAQVLKSSGLSDSAIERLVAYSNDAVAQFNTYADNFAKDACTQKGKTSEELAQYFDSRAGEEDALKENLVHSLGGILSDDEERVFKEWAHESNSITMRDTPSSSEVAREQRMMPDEIVDLFCQRGTKK